MEKILFLFMMFSIVGWLWETPWVSFRVKKYVNRGFLHGPYIPIYGSAVITIILSMGIFDGLDSNNLFVILLQIVYMGLITAIWEFLTSWGLEKVFHTRWWDYSRHKFNIQGRISLHVTMFFALGGFILWHFILPVFESFYYSVPSLPMIIALVLLYAIFTVDSVVTLRDLFKLRDVIDTMERLSKELAERVDSSIAGIKAQSKIRKDNLKISLFELKKQLQEQYNALDDNPVKLRVSKELNKISEVLKTRRRINRFFEKYPNSFSRQLGRSRVMLKRIANRSKK